MSIELFSKRLKLLRKNKGLTQQELAEKIDVKPSTIGMYEQGRREPDGDTLKKLSKVLNVSIDYLLGKGNSMEGNREVSSILTEFTNELSSYEGLMFDGKTVSDEDREKLIGVIKTAVKLAVGSK